MKVEEIKKMGAGVHRIDAAGDEGNRVSFSDEFIHVLYRNGSGVGFVANIPYVRVHVYSDFIGMRLELSEDIYKEFPGGVENVMYIVNEHLSGNTITNGRIIAFLKIRQGVYVGEWVEIALFRLTVKGHTKVLVSPVEGATIPESHPLRGRDVVSLRYLNDHVGYERYRDIMFTPDSVKRFYSSMGRTVKTLSKSFVADWWNYDCPELRRIEINMDGGRNMLGMQFVCFEPIMIEDGGYVNDVTEKEAKILTRDYPGSWMSEKIWSKVDSSKLSPERKKELVKKIEEFESVMTDLWRKNEEYVLKITAKTFGKEMLTAAGCIDYLTRVDGTMGLDCGWVNLMATGDMGKAYQLLHDAGERDTVHIKVGGMNIPVQSTTIKRAVANVFCGIAKRSGIDIYPKTILD